MAAPTLNATAFYPSDISVEEERVGSFKRAANGKGRFVYRATKRVWTLTWTDVPLATLTAVRVIHALTSSFAFVDENGTSYTVLCEAGALSSNVERIATESGAQVLFYSITLKLTEV